MAEMNSVSCFPTPTTSQPSVLCEIFGKRSDGQMALEFTDDGQTINVGVSYGVASIPDPDNRINQAQQIIDVADKSLYQAKAVKYNVNFNHESAPWAKKEVQH